MQNTLNNDNKKNKHTHLFLLSQWFHCQRIMHAILQDELCNILVQFWWFQILWKQCQHLFFTVSELSKPTARTRRGRWHWNTRSIWEIADPSTKWAKKYNHMEKKHFHLTDLSYPHCSWCIIHNWFFVCIQFIINHPFYYCCQSIIIPHTIWKLNCMSTSLGKLKYWTEVSPNISSN